MSSLLKEAIVDAKALREAALKSAETTIVEKYSDEVRKTLENILEQDELGLGGDLGGEGGLGGDLGMEDPGAMAPEAELAETEEVIEDIPLAAADDLGDEEGEGLRHANLPATGEPVDVEVDINLAALQEAISELQTQMDESQELEITEEEMVEILSDAGPEILDEAEEEVIGDTAGEAASDEENAEEKEFTGSGDAGAGPVEEELDLDEITAAVQEVLDVDMKASLSGWAGRSSYDMKHQMEMEMAHRRSTDLQKDLETLKKAQEEVVFENKQLKDELSQYKQATNELKEGLQDVNLSNARLLYTNRVLRNTSLNERQKETIVEAISRAGSVTEARTIFDTLQSTAQARPKKSPQSLSEALGRRSSATVIRASRSRHERSTSDADPFQDRMKRLAGIK
tara:strand:- start:1079 stop:2275 length:1197 start_codon:yes stop_codon:yes gene_type:complete